MRLIRLFSAMSLVAAIAIGCGGGGGGGAVSSLSDAEVRAAISSVTIAYDDVYNGNAPLIRRYAADPVSGMVNIRVSLPLATNAVESDYRQKFLNSVIFYNQLLSGYLNLDVTSASLTLDNVNNQGYWQVSYNTAYVPAGSTDYQSYCANVSDAANSGSSSWSNILTAAWTYADNPLNRHVSWVNLGNGNCTLSQEIVTHEVAHALGLNRGHFSGFGIGSPTSSNLWTVLLTLYKNPMLTPVSQAVIYR